MVDCWQSPTEKALLNNTKEIWDWTKSHKNGKTQCMKKALTQKEVRDQLTTPYCNDLGDHQNDSEHVPIVPFICKCRTIVHRQRK